LEEKKSILTVALDKETSQRMAPLLGRTTFTVQSVEQAHDGIALAERQQFHLVICRYPLPDMTLRSFVASIHGEGSLSTEASLMLLTIPEMESEARAGIQGERILVFSGQEPLGTLDRGAAHLLQVAPRHSPRIGTSLRVKFEGRPEVFAGWVVNLSVSGMLIKDAPMLPIGTECVFEFKLPNGETIRGLGEVVRHSLPRKERVAGFALRFKGFDPNCREALDAWCVSERR
jgi:CheY-like chemotaxis protein